MPSKTEEYLALAQRTANGLTRYWESWTDYLTTASRLYKYPFADQLMIYAQRPDATACADFDIWNNRMNRYVRRGSKGIALLDQSSSVPRLHYVFDVSDTGVRRNSRDPEVWQLGPDLVQPVSEMIAREYGVYHERLSRQISDLTGKLVDSYWDNNGGDIRAIVDGSLLMDYDEAGVEMQFKSAAAISVTYTLLERCGFEPAGWFDKDDFQAIYNFSTPDNGHILGLTVFQRCSFTATLEDGTKLVEVFMPRDIVIDSALAADRCTGCRNFTIAHEAAHQILADLFPNDYGKAVKCRGHIAYRERNGKPSWEEWQADTLAAELLMPTFLINAEIERVALTLPNGILYKSVSDPNYEKILEVARRIGVSWSAIRIRLQQMQVIKGKPIHCHPLDIMRFGE